MCRLNWTYLKEQESAEYGGFPFLLINHKEGVPDPSDFKTEDRNFVLFIRFFWIFYFRDGKIKYK